MFRSAGGVGCRPLLLFACSVAGNKGKVAHLCVVFVLQE